MNEQHVMTLFHQAGASLEPDVTRLVADGAARGRRRRRRRVAGAALAVAAIVGATTLTGAMLSRNDDPAPEVTSPADHVRQVAVAPEEMDATLAGLLPGARPLEGDEPYQYQIQLGAVEWHGVQVTVSIDSRSVGITTTARERCETFLGQPCAEAPGGAWIAEHGLIEPAGRRPETYSDVVTLYDPDGYVIEAVGERGSAEAVDQGEGSDADRELLRRLVLDEVWLR